MHKTQCWLCLTQSMSQNEELRCAWVASLCLHVIGRYTVQHIIPVVIATLRQIYLRTSPEKSGPRALLSSLDLWFFSNKGFNETELTCKFILFCQSGNVGDLLGLGDRPGVKVNCFCPGYPGPCSISRKSTLKPCEALRDKIQYFCKYFDLIVLALINHILVSLDEKEQF